MLGKYSLPHAAWALDGWSSAAANTAAATAPNLMLLPTMILPVVCRKWRFANRFSLPDGPDAAVGLQKRPMLVFVEAQLELRGGWTGLGARGVAARRVDREQDLDGVGSDQGPDDLSVAGSLVLLARRVLPGHPLEVDGHDDARRVAELLGLGHVGPDPGLAGKRHVSRGTLHRARERDDEDRVARGGVAAGFPIGPEGGPHRHQRDEDHSRGRFRYRHRSLTPGRAWLQRGRLDVVRSAERHALRARNRGRQRAEERLARVIDLPPDEHRVVLVHRVVAVLHEHSAEVAELHGEGHAARRTEPVDVLAALLPRRHVRGAAVAGEDLAFLEVDVDGVIPSAAAVLDRPDLASPVPGSSRDASEVGVQHPVVVGLHAPRSEEGADRVVRVLASTGAELEHALTHHRDLREIGVRDHRARNLAQVRCRGVAHDAELQEPADAGVLRLARERVAQGQVLRRLLPVRMLAQVDHVDALADLVAREVDDDVVALGDALLVELVQHHRVREQVAVFRYLDHRRAVGERDLEEARNRRVQDAEAVLAALDLEVGLVRQVHGHHVTDEPVEVEDVEEHLAVGVEGLFGEHEIYVVFQVAPVLARARGELEVDAVVDAFVTAIQGAVQVEHSCIALVHVLRGEAEHVIVEPVRRHGLLPVAGELGDAAAPVGAAAARIGRVGVHAAEAGMNDRVMVVVELARVEVSARETVVLGAVMAVVLVRRDGVDAEPGVRPRIRGQLVVVPEEDPFIVPADQKLGRNRAVEGPEVGRVLVRHVRVERRTNRLGCVDAAVEPRLAAGVVVQERLRGRLRNLDGDLRREALPLLVRPDRPRRTAFDRARVASLHARNSRVEKLLGLVRLLLRSRPREVGKSLALQYVEARHRLRERRSPEQRAGRRAGRNRRIGAIGERAQAVLQSDGPCCADEPHLDEVATGYLLLRESLDDFSAVVPSLLGFPETVLGCIAWQIHCVLLSFSGDAVVPGWSPRTRSALSKLFSTVPETTKRDVDSGPPERGTGRGSPDGAAG